MARHRIEWDRAVHTKEQFPTEPWPQVAFAGRSNVGKSSLLNRLFRQKLAGVSRTPGKTRSINYYRVDDTFFLVDLPGYGYAQKAKSERRKFAALTGYFLENTPHLTGVVQLVDLRHLPSELDLRVADYLQRLDLAHLVVLTKADKLSRGAGNKRRQEISQQLKLEPNDPVVFSAVDGRGVQSLWSWIVAQTEGVGEDA